MEMRSYTRSSEGESSESSKRRMLEGHAAGGSKLEYMRRSHSFSPDNTPTNPQSHELREVQQIVSNLEEVQLIANPLFEEMRSFVPLGHKVDQAQVVQTDQRSSEGSTQGREHVGPKEQADAYWSTLSKEQKNKLREFMNSIKQLVKNLDHTEQEAIDSTKVLHPEGHELYEQIKKKLEW